MLYRDPKCVFVANDFGQAEVVVSWLEEHGIPAEVMSQSTAGGLMSPLLTGIQVRVVDAEQAPQAIQLLGDHALSQLTAKKPDGPPVVVSCDECGKISRFPAKERGSVQTCPHCSAYIDVEPLDGSEPATDSGESEEDEDDGPGRDGITDRGPGGISKQ